MLTSKFLVNLVRWKSVESGIEAAQAHWHPQVCCICCSEDTWSSLMKHLFLLLKSLKTMIISKLSKFKKCCNLTQHIDQIVALHFMICNSIPGELEENFLKHLFLFLYFILKLYFIFSQCSSLLVHTLHTFESHFTGECPRFKFSHKSLSGFPYAHRYLWGPSSGSNGPCLWSD